LKRYDNLYLRLNDIRLWLQKSIEIKREYNSTSLCEICFTTAQNSNLYRLDMGFEIDGVTNKKSKILCSSCIKELKETLKGI
jgi:hypothetical protein